MSLLVYGRIMALCVLKLYILWGCNSPLCKGPAQDLLVWTTYELKIRLKWDFNWCIDHILTPGIGASVILHM